MIKLAEQKACTGCMSCYNSCAQGAIEIKENDEGFLYPRINVEKCVECGLCIKRCPELNARATIHQSPKVYAIINNKDKKVSSSGGAFSLIARWILEQGGVVFGASMNDNPSAQRIDWFDLAKGVAIILYVDMNFRRYGNALMFYAGGLSGTLLVMKLSMLTTGGKIFSLISS